MSARDMHSMPTRRSSDLAQATIVWDLNPSDQNGPTGGSSQTFTSSGFSITAYGFDNNSGIGSAHDLFFKNVSPIGGADRKSTRLNSSHVSISYAVFCLKK